ncbi:serine/arginine repetitive matrix protein 2-like [Fundulus heteroclitus]|uniref:serine/arginine repetitive matrix protein 2-like n=1 Tax=Fundulus heteroclitus TaxID=8078 RepID=UPI00165A6D70|nr:serine/arginine repetitive matrix protein 2-like [Fundulus heteroclitus]
MICGEKTILDNKSKAKDLAQHFVKVHGSEKFSGKERRARRKTITNNVHGCQVAAVALFLSQVAADHWAVLSAGVQHQRGCGDGFKRKRLTAPLRQSVNHTWWTAPNPASKSLGELSSPEAELTSLCPAPLSCHLNKLKITPTPALNRRPAVSRHPRSAVRSPEPSQPSTCQQPQEQQPQSSAAHTSSLRPQSSAASAHSPRRYVLRSVVTRTNCLIPLPV